MYKIFLLLAGGGMGTLMRFYISGLTHKYYFGTFPLGTLLVNLVGSFIIGFIWGLWEQGNVSSGLRTFVFIGLLGGFTTFSTFTLETYHFFRENEIKLAIINILANNILGLLLVYGGFVLSKGIINFIK